MFCPSCGADAGNAKFCENCGASLIDTAQNQVGSAYQQPNVEYAEAPDLPPSASEPATPYQTPSYQQPAPYQQSAHYQPPVDQSNMAPNVAFVLVIVGLILSFLGATFLPGLICSIVGLVLNAGYNKRGLNNPHATSTKVVGIIGIVISALVIVSFIFLGVFAAILVNESEQQGIDITTSSASVSVDSSGVSVSTPGSSSAAASSGSTSSGPASSGSTSTSVNYEDSLYHDSDYNPTMYALMELSGKEMSELLASYNFSWDSAENGWIASDNAIYAVTDGSSLLSKSNVEKLAKGAKGEPVILCLFVPGYSTPKDAFRALSGGIVEEEYKEISGYVVAVVYGPSMVRYLAIVGDNTFGNASGQMVYLATEESIKSGVLSDLMGADLGSSIDDAWQKIASLS